MSDEMREAFEKWYAQKYLGVNVGDAFEYLPSHGYKRLDVHFPWLGYQAATAAADAKYLPVIENQKETIRCMSVVFDDIAAQLNLPKEQYGDPDALMDAIEELKDKATLAATVVKGGE